VLDNGIFAQRRADVVLMGSESGLISRAADTQA